MEDTKLPEQDDPGTAFFKLFHPEIRVFKAELSVFLAQHQWEDPQHSVFDPGVIFDALFVGGGTAVHKRLFLAEMAVHVAEDSDLSVLRDHFDQIFGTENGRVEDLTRVHPFTVQIYA
jgi:hypothetical protein